MEGVDDLREALRERSGLRPGGLQPFSVRCGDRNVNVRFDTDGDDELTRMVVSVIYDFVAQPMPSYRETEGVPAPRPLDIVLTREDAADRAAKAEGLAVEWQSGDATFDDQVYVRTPTRDPGVLAAVLGPEARAATLALFDQGFESVEIDVDGYVQATLPASALVRPGAPDRAEVVVDLFGRLISRLPMLASTGPARGRAPYASTTQLLMLVGAAGWLLNVGWLGIVILLVSKMVGRHVEPGPSAALVCVGFGVFVGVLGFRFYGDVVADAARGRSDAHRVAAQARWSAFAGGSVLAFTASLVLALLASR
jgi:hypothetical protein